mmetsp:Transcript_84077/g.126041  ORF Transcript_84077/g.126041 Transcript_84077/m.126041 type:complete len:596 (+) Transcript_84077:34-1821(+)
MVIPSYSERQRGGWKPNGYEDFGDGGAFPEVHMPQFPSGIGEKKTSGSIIPLNIDASGKINFGAVLGIHDKKKVYSSARDLVERDPDESELIRPSEDEERETTELTQQALSKNIKTKIAAAVPAKPAQKQAEATYFRYTPEGKNKQERVIKLIEMPIDPLDPPKFKHKKVARGPGSPPVPIVHSPPRKLTQKDHEEWKIPPCISNWKNQRGMTIALDKRLAADGRGLQKPQINDKFAQFAESMYLAERNARTMVETRTEINRLVSEKERREKEEALAEMAARARNARTKNYGDDENDEARRERDRLREERRRQTEREMRLENLKGKRKRDEDRDISERIALGQAAPTLTGEAMFDQRLFNQSQGISQGFGAEDNYNVFDKPLFNGGTSSKLFRPKKGAEDIYGSDADLEALKNSKRFQADKGFRGAEKEGNKPRTVPVEFEKQPDTGDDFDFLDDFMDEAKTAKMDDVLSKTMMSAPRRPVETGDRRKRSPSPNGRSPRRSPSPRRRSRSPPRRRHRSPRSRSPRGRWSRSPPRRRDRNSRDRSRENYRRGPYDRPDRSPDRRSRSRRSPSPDRRSRRSPSPRRSRRSPDRRSRR